MISTHIALAIVPLGVTLQPLALRLLLLEWRMRGGRGRHVLAHAALERVVEFLAVAPVPELRARARVVVCEGCEKFVY